MQTSFQSTLAATSGDDFDQPQNANRVFRSVYNSSTGPEDLALTCSQSSEDGQPQKKASYGLDAPLGLAMSTVAAPLYLYASLKGKSDLWDTLLAQIPDETFSPPSLDVGCGRGLVLLKVAQRKKALAAGSSVERAYGIDIFIKGDQTGNSAHQTLANAAALDVTAHVALHKASFTEPLPFADAAFALVTASLSLHNVDARGRQAAMREIVRVCRPGGRLVIIDLAGYVGGYATQLREAAWPEDNIKLSWGGPGVMFGAWPVRVLAATCPGAR